MKRYAAMIGLAFSGQLFAQDSLYKETKSTVTQWAETESLISKELNDWKKDKAVLEDMAAMLEREKEALAEKIEQARASATEADQRRAEILERKEALEEANAEVKESLADLEEGVRDLFPYMPDNYTESIAPLMRQMPKKGQSTSQPVSIRMRNIIGILSQSNKFDNVISVETEAREFEDGTSKQVKTMYLGFAIAYYTDATGKQAGYGFPTEDGWEWVESPQYGRAIVDAIAMYEKGKQADFVRLPVVVN